MADRKEEGVPASGEEEKVPSGDGTSLLWNLSCLCRASDIAREIHTKDDLKKVMEERKLPLPPVWMSILLELKYIPRAVKWTSGFMTFCPITAAAFQFSTQDGSKLAKLNLCVIACANGTFDCIAIPMDATSLEAPVYHNNFEGDFEEIGDVNTFLHTLNVILSNTYGFKDQDEDDDDTEYDFMKD
mmetsp:Transcript_22357/g.62785  ORF Transcript_22357/g.62785 Transcript_22357/m.62785 type:complete len:186 (-) Transcript_22357:249-806(-)|eukprot:CAMPEP_0119156720 /NCGR_PEP_ID=MMETSP1310-20130426/52398_1 /TAXON_ID=464262 /ORGANISM="Genus nov. species nov., Strain RCC2339" /LENGTH=185 /DNA_ID=CAMNT_0007149335 /DNA_START=134 /DNA_END=691 /DNA_ORIENTATION=+